jgi:hypothetical protein
MILIYLILLTLICINVNIAIDSNNYYYYSNNNNNNNILSTESYYYIARNLIGDNETNITQSNSTFIPSESPNANPTFTPSAIPTADPTFVDPSFTPSASPTTSPSVSPTAIPTFTRTIRPTLTPTLKPTQQPIAPGQPTFFPTEYIEPIKIKFELEIGLTGVSSNILETADENAIIAATALSMETDINNVNFVHYTSELITRRNLRNLIDISRNRKLVSYSINCILNASIDVPDEIAPTVFYDRIKNNTIKAQSNGNFTAYLEYESNVVYHSNVTATAIVSELTVKAVSIIYSPTAFPTFQPTSWSTEPFYFDYLVISSYVAGFIIVFCCFGSVYGLV